MYYRDRGLLKVYVRPPGSQRFTNSFSTLQKETGNRAKSKVTTAENCFLVGIRQRTGRLAVLGLIKELHSDKRAVRDKAAFDRNIEGGACQRKFTIHARRTNASFYADIFEFVEHEGAEFHDGAVSHDFEEFVGGEAVALRSVWILDLSDVALKKFTEKRGLGRADSDASRSRDTAVTSRIPEFLSSPTNPQRRSVA
jgi:hypothetical protein